MTGRIRSIKPEWLEDEKLSDCSSDARVLSVALLLLADDYGNGRAGLKQLTGRVFAGRDIGITETALSELAAIRFVGLYENGGQTYFSVRTWSKHQRVEKPGKPRVPGPPKDLFGSPRETLANVPDALAKLPETVGTDPDPDLDPEHRNVGDGPPTRTRARENGEPTEPSLSSPSPESTHEKQAAAEAVRRIAADFGRRFGMPIVDVRPGEPRWDLIAEALESLGEDRCLLVLAQAERDDTVNGRDRAIPGQHRTLQYIFQPHVRERLFGDANQREKRVAKTQRRPTTDSRDANSGELLTPDEIMALARKALGGP